MTLADTNEERELSRESRTGSERGRRGGPPRGRRPGGGGGGGGGGRGPRPGGPKSREPIEPLHPTAEPPDVKSFREFTLNPELLDAIEASGITVPTPIQALTIQPLLDGRDVIAKAETGTGKTLAFGAPILSKIEPGRSTVLALILCPTRELAQQVCGVMATLGEARNVKTALVVGGEPMQDQVEALQQGAQVVVGTPGRVLDLYGQGFLSFPWTEFVVLDEADEMLEIGFLDDVKKILSFTPDERQTMHFSATFPREVLALARSSTRDPVEVATAKGLSTVDTIEQTFVKVQDTDRPLALRRLIETSEEEDVFLVFCDRRTEVDRLMRVLERAPFSTKALHGGFDQASRFRVMTAFRGRDVKALIATDVASRGLDVAHVTHVVNFAVPQGMEDYTHRIGRTGRAGRKGKAITFVTPGSERDWAAITRNMPWTIPEGELPPKYGGHDRGGSRDRGPRRPAERGRGPRPERASPPRREPPADREREEPRRDTERTPEPAARRPRTRGAEGGRARRAETTRERLARERREAEQGAGGGARPERAPSREPSEAPREERPERSRRPERSPRAEGASREREPRQERAPRGRPRAEQAEGERPQREAPPGPVPAAREPRSSGSSARRPEPEPEPDSDDGFGAGV